MKNARITSLNAEVRSQSIFTCFVSYTETNMFDGNYTWGAFVVKLQSTKEDAENVRKEISKTVPIEVMAAISFTILWRTHI